MILVDNIEREYILLTKMTRVLQKKFIDSQRANYDKPITVEVENLKNFVVAEEYHQDFYKKDPEHYKRYRGLSGRDTFIDSIWK